MSTWKGRSQRANKCIFCGRTVLYWYRNQETGQNVPFEADGISHNVRCPDRRGQHVNHGIVINLRDHNVIPAPKETRNRGRRGDNGYDEIEPRQEEDRYGEIEDMPKDAVPVPTVTFKDPEDKDAITNLITALVASGLEIGMAEHLVRVSELVEDRLRDLQAAVKVEVHDKKTGEIRNVGITHKVMPEVLNDLQIGLNVWLVGPMGTGKTTIARQCAEALGVPFGYQSITIRMPEHTIVGFTNMATGEYVRTLFRDIWEHGGVFLFDECDAGDPNSLLMVNAALAGQPMAFPDGLVPKHPNCYILAAANTNGLAADRNYVGRMQLDAAFLDRFGSYIEVDIDEQLETMAALTFIKDQELGQRYIKLVREIRANSYRLQVKAPISPRASINGCVMLNDGQKWSRVIEKAVQKGLSAQDWSRITEDVVLGI